MHARKDGGADRLAGSQNTAAPWRKTVLYFVIAAVLTASVGMLTGCGSSSSGGTEPADTSPEYEEDTSGGDAADADISEEVEDMSQFDSYTVAFEDMTRGEGVYVVNSDKTQATRLWDKPGHMKVNYFDGIDYTVEDADWDGNNRLEGAYVENIVGDPAYVNISAGEELALVLSYDPYIRMYQGSFIGYGNYDKSDELTGYEEISGVDLSDVETVAEANERLADTGLRFHEYESSSYYDYSLLLSDTRGEQVTVGTYAGTAFEEETYSFDNAFYLFQVTGLQKPEIEKTKDGYFTIDLSGMAPGIYYLDIAAGEQTTGQETFIIEIA